MDAEVGDDTDTGARDHVPRFMRDQRLGPMHEIRLLTVGGALWELR